MKNENKNKNKKSLEYVQRIQEHYVSDDCIQLMVPQTGPTLTLLSDEGIVYHNANVQPEKYINKYLEDGRRNKFPYSDIPTHKQSKDMMTYLVINQLLEYDKPYIEITEGITERYVVKDGEEALIVAKCLEPSRIENRVLTNAGVRNLLQQENQIVLLANGMINEDKYFATEEQIVELERKELEKQLAEAKAYIGAYGETPRDAMLVESLERNIKGLSINTVLPTDYMDVALIEYDKDKMIGIKVVSISFIESEKYQVVIKNYPIKRYTLDEALQIEKESSKIAKEPTFSRFINFGIDRSSVKAGSKFIIERKKGKYLVREK